MEAQLAACHSISQVHTRRISRLPISEPRMLTRRLIPSFVSAGVFPLPGYIGGCSCSTSISSCAPRLAHILPSICDAAMPGAGSDEGSALAVHMEVPLATAGGVAPWPPASSAAPRLQLPLPLSVDQFLHVASGFPLPLEPHTQQAQPVPAAAYAVAHAQGLAGDASAPAAHKDGDLPYFAKGVVDPATGSIPYFAKGVVDPTTGSVGTDASPPTSYSGAGSKGGGRGGRGGSSKSHGHGHVRGEGRGAGKSRGGGSRPN